MEAPSEVQADDGVCGLDSESSVASELDVEEKSEQPRLGATSLFKDFPGVPEADLYVHRLSGIVHVMNEDDSFVVW